MRLSRLTAAAGGAAALLLTALPAQAAHESNNKADLSGAASGTAVVNYIEGRDGQQWTATTRLQDLQAGTYSFVLIAPNGTEGVTVCTFSSDGAGSAGCSNSSFDTGGFAGAQIQDEDGDVVASGTFVRRGGRRAG